VSDGPKLSRDRMVRWHRVVRFAQTLDISELQLLSGEHPLQVANVIVPFHLHLVHWAELFVQRH
jgi:hypothetical protein